MVKHMILSLVIISFFSIAFSQEAPLGSPSKASGKEKKALKGIEGKFSGTIVWSSSRSNSKHDLWIMNADGTNKKHLTKSNTVDWFPRISPDGQKILFTRSKSGWVPETEAEFHDKWDLWTINIDGTEEKKILDNACWGSWTQDGSGIVFARGAKALKMDLGSNSETLLLDGEATFKKGTIVQQPQLSSNGKLLAATLRGSSRETGVYNLDKKEWYKTGAGCQINWFPSGTEIYRVNPTGNGGSAAPSEILAQKLNNGKPIENIKKTKKFRLMDLPGRRSHEYFPKFDQKGEYMVWCATDKGHDHDLYDYEVYVWKKGTPVKEAVRLTFHSANDRWPDIYMQ